MPVDEPENGLESRSSRKTGILHQRNPVDASQWVPQLFVLARGRLCYTEERLREDSDEDSCDEERSEDRDRHLAEKWYHGKMPGGRTAAEELLNR